MSSHVASTTAIKNVIKAFGNAPFTGQTADAFGRTTGITLHVVKSDSLSEVAPFYVWRDASTSDTNANNDFYNVKLAKFGTVAERGGTSGTSLVPGLNHCDVSVNPPNCTVWNGYRLAGRYNKEGRGQDPETLCLSLWYVGKLVD